VGVGAVAGVGLTHLLPPAALRDSRLRQVRQQIEEAKQQLSKLQHSLRKLKGRTDN
jgi:hypothetical protein